MNQQIEIKPEQFIQDVAVKKLAYESSVNSLIEAFRMVVTQASAMQQQQMTQKEASKMPEMKEEGAK